MFKRVRVTFYYNFRSLGALGKPNLILHPKLQFKPYRTDLNFDLNGTNFLTHFKWILKLEIVATEIEIWNAHSYQTGLKCSFPSKMQKFYIPHSILHYHGWFLIDIATFFEHVATQLGVCV